MASYLKVLFSVNFLHTFYKDGETPDFLVEPVAETARQIKRHRLQYRANSKSNATGFSLVFPATDNVPTPLLPIQNDVKFVFTLTLKNGAFMNFTDATQLPGMGEIVRFYNDGTATLQSEILELKSDIINHAFSFPIGPLPGSQVVKVLNSNGAEVLSVTATSPSLDFEIQLDLQGIDPGVYKISHPGNTGFDKFVYIDANSFRKGIFGILEITNSLALPINYASPKAYTYGFTNRQDFWNYFIVYTGGVNLGHKIMDDEDYGSSDPPYSGPLFAFSEFLLPLSGAVEQTKNALEAQFPGAVVSLIKSNTVIDFFQLPKVDLMLKDSLGTTTIIEQLPNPPVKNPRAEAFVFI